MYLCILDKMKGMKQKKILLEKFVKYLDKNRATRIRGMLFIILRNNFADHDENYESVYVEDISKEDFLEMQNAGEATWNEFEVLRAEYIEKRKTNKLDNRGGARKGAGRKINVSGEKKVRHTISMRPDIIRTLQTLDNYSLLVEVAILKELKRRKIKLI